MVIVVVMGLNLWVKVLCCLCNWHRLKFLQTGDTTTTSDVTKSRASWGCHFSFDHNHPPPRPPPAAPSSAATNPRIMGLSLPSAFLLLAVTGAVHGQWGDKAEDNFNEVHDTAKMAAGVIIAIVIAALVTPCIIACCICACINALNGRKKNEGVIHPPAQPQQQTGGHGLLTPQYQQASFNPGYPAQHTQTFTASPGPYPAQHTQTFTASPGSYPA